MSSIGALLEQGLQLHRAGRLAEAAALYQQVLAAGADHAARADAWHLLGLVDYQSGRPQQALPSLQKAVSLRPGNASYCNSLGAALVALARIDEAAGYFRHAVKLNPDYADAHSNLGNACFEKGQYEEAVAHCRKATQADTKHADAWYNLGNALCALAASNTLAASNALGSPGPGQVAPTSSAANPSESVSARRQHVLSESVEAYRKSLAVRPGFPKAHNNLANTLLLLSRVDEAVEQYRQAVAIDPSFAEAHKNLGSVLKDRGQIDAAIEAFRAALRAKPDYPDALNRLGITLFEQGDYDQAEACYRRAIAVQPEFVEAHNNLGALFTDLKRYDDAVAFYLDALMQRPLSAEMHYNLGNAYKAQGKIQDAVASFRRALEIAPAHPKASNNLGNTLKLLGRLSEALDCYRNAVGRSPRDLILLDNLAAAYKQMGLVEDAAETYRRTIPLRPASPLYELRIDALCPPVFESDEAVDAFHERLNAALDRYRALEIRATEDEVVAVGCEPPFDMAYHGRNERRLREKFADALRHCFTPRIVAPNSGKPGLAFLVTRDHEGIFLRSTRGLIEQLDGRRFDVTVVCAESGLARIRGEIARTDIAYLPIPDTFAETAARVREARFDLIYYWECGSDPFNYFFPFLRLAPVQCIGWGTNYTSGVPQMDYYLSSDLVEPPDADEHYSETLVRLPTLPTYQYRPQIPPVWKPRAAFGLEDGQHVYLCAQNLRKFQPDFDPVLGEILRRDPAGVLVITKPEYEHLEPRLRARFGRTMRDVVDRVRFVPRMPYVDYLNLTALADVVLDPFHFGSGVTAYDALALGKPIVTCPSAYQRGRYVLGCHRKMGLLDTVADTPAQYAEIALRLGADEAYRRELGQRIHAAADVLFEDLDAVRHHEAFFERAIATARERL